MTRHLTALALAIVAAGCMVGPKYKRPPIAGTPALKEPPPAGWKEAEPNEGILRGRWWEIYNDPHLNELASKVELSNQNVIAAMARYREAVDQIQIARAALFPSVTASPSAIVTRGSSLSSRGQLISGNSSGATSSIGSGGTSGGSGSGTSGGGSGVNVNYAMPFDISYQADIWGNIRRSVTASKDTAQASAADLENAKLTFQAQLAQMYFQLHGLDADADLLRRNVIVFEQSLQLTQERFNAGVASGADVAQAKTQLETTRAQLIEVGVGRAQFEHAIAVLIGETPAMVSVPEETVNRPPPQIPLGLPSTLIERRPDVAATERAIAAANEQIGIAKAAYFPMLTLSGTGGFVSTSLARLFTVPSLFWSLGPQLAATLFDGGLRKGQLRLSKDAYDESVAIYRQTVLTAFQQVEDQLSSLRILEQEQSAQAEARQAAQEAVDIAMAQYRAGTADYLAVIVLQAALLQAERQEIDILTRRLTASVLLIEALGGGWDTSQLPSYEPVFPCGGNAGGDAVPERDHVFRTLKYVFMATSANFGNMFSMAGASLFLPFLPLLPKQILLTNLLTDIPELTIGTDRVDADWIDRPHRWNVRFIRNVMLTFGALSSVFDYVTFGVLLWVMNAGAVEFRTGAGRSDTRATHCQPALHIVAGSDRRSNLRHRGAPVYADGRSPGICSCSDVACPNDRGDCRRICGQR